MKLHRKKAILVLMAALLMAGLPMSRVQAVDYGVKSDYSTEPDYDTEPDYYGTELPAQSAVIHIGDIIRVRDYFTQLPENVAQWEYTSDDENVASVDAEGKVTAKQAGSVAIQIRGREEYNGVTGEGGKAYYGYLNLTVSINMDSVTLDKTSVTAHRFYENPVMTLKLLNTQGYLFNSYSWEDQISYESSNPNMWVDLSVVDNVVTLTPYGAGKTTITLKINDKTFTIHMQVNQVQVSVNNFLLAVKGKRQLKVTGIGGKVTWKSSNNKVASVSSKGKVTGKKKGNAIITATVAGGKVGCVVSVLDSKTVKICKYATYMGTHWKYSQAKRMQKGYYDCSALVWKAYRKYNKYVGSKTYAPTAADSAKWCAKKGKVIVNHAKQSHVNQMLFRPGDLLYKTGEGNGRYKGIYHVEMITGYYFCGFDSKGKAILELKWAAREVGYYYYGDPVERPFK